MRWLLTTPQRNIVHGNLEDTGEQLQATLTAILHYPRHNTDVPQGLGKVFRNLFSDFKT